MKTIHGQFDFRLQKYLVKGKSCNYFDLTSQLTRENISHGLQELVAYYSNRISYQEVENLVERISGEKLLSDQKIWDIVVNKAVEVSSQWQQEIQSIKQSIKSESQIASLVDIYNPLSQEILLFDDGIGVKKQKENRHKKQDVVISESDESGKKQKRQTVTTDVVLLETPKGSFEYLTSPIDNQGQSLISLEEIIKCKLKYYYHNCNFFLPIVAITDGASSIRKRLYALNPQGITLILDWYHLCKKLREFLSMITRNKAEKTEHSKFLFCNLWRGNTRDVLTYLKTQIKARNQKKLDELITYITKHQSEIINYELRRKTGKTIGSGRMEKGVDIVIGHRQKHKGMSWSSLGSKALAILKVTECNGKWRQTWFPQMAA
ncbi:MAG: hypothetical protein QNJ65_20625 [Xenococcaceae cyanobacterium MO_234.B1]|nr:hypothetical protein [Xenococcaceae cyanobacterium MO_234.B1]